MDLMLAVFGVTVLILSWIQLLVSTSKVDYTWGLCSFFAPPLSYLYGFFRLDVAKDALILALVGWILLGLSQL